MCVCLVCSHDASKQASVKLLLAEHGLPICAWGVVVLQPWQNDVFFGGACQCQLNFGVRQIACQTHFFPELLGMALCVLALF